MGRKKRKPKKPPAYQFKKSEIATYLGNQYEGYHGERCIVIEHSKTKRKEYDKIQFDDGKIFETIPSALKKIELNERLEQL
jgi:hypothetical protein